MSNRIIYKKIRKRKRVKEQMDRLESIFTLDYNVYDEETEDTFYEVSVFGSGDLFVKAYETEDEIAWRLRAW